MESIKLDIRNLRTVQNHAKAYGISKPTVYKQIKEGSLRKVIIDGVTFVHRVTQGC